MRISLVILSFFICSFSHAQNFSLKGRIIDLTTKEPVYNGVVKLYLEDYLSGDTIKEKYYPDLFEMKARDTVYVKPKLRIKDSAISNSKGDFSFFGLKGGLYYIRCKVKFDTIGYRYDDLKHVLVNNDSVFVELKPEVYCTYSKFRNQNNCPICSKNDQLLKVVYGLPVYSLNDPTKIDSKPDEYWIGDCIFDELCHARWYCSRCRKLF